MTEQIGGFSVALLFVALIGVLIFVNALLGMGLRWVGRRVAAVWRHDDPATVEGGPAVERRQPMSYH